MKLLHVWLLAGTALGFTGCRSIGPGTVARDRYDYSGAIAESWKRQTLLNIVKLRYFDPPIFVDVGQIVSGYTLETALTAGGNFPEGGPSSASIGGSARYTDRPTVTYVPLTGNQFVKALMTPLPPESVFFMIQSGWPADGVLMAAAGSLNGLKNQTTGISGATPPEPDFLRVLELLRNLQRSGMVSFRVMQDSAKQLTSLLVFRGQNLPENTVAEMRELRRLLRLDPAATEFTLAFGGTAGNDREIAVITRSIMHIMTTMAAQVEVPADDVAEGRATPGLDLEQESARAYGLVRVRNSKGKPADASVAVQYRGQWYWIDDRDLRSKRAFAFMLMLFTLADTGSKEPPPLITIPAQ